MPLIFDFHCTNPGCEFEMPSGRGYYNRDEKACPECRSNAVKTLDELVDERCPVCEAGTVVAEDTGAIA